MTAAVALFVASCLPLGLSADPPQPGQPAGEALEVVYYDTVLEDGTLTGGTVLMPRVVIDPEARIPSNVETLWDPHPNPGDGPGLDRIDLVIVGDGYQSGQLGLYATHTQSAVTALFNQEPFRAYQNFFRVHRVDVVSQDSGVDHDPVQGILRNTALNMGFWCQGTERLLCVDVNRAYSYANNAPNGVNQVLAIANSSKYGGAGYPSADLATLAGGNSAAAEIAIHEMGHSLGNLADEYDYGGGTLYSGPEVPEPNASIYTSSTMSSQSRKWFRWLGVSDPLWDGMVSTYVGCRYYEQGIYRPTNNSKMRALGRPFNLPSAEALIGEFYRIVRPVQDSTPTTQVLNGTETVFVDPIDITPNTISIQWSLDLQPIPGATGLNLNLDSLNISPGAHTLSVRVVDNTPWVRDPGVRTQRMTEQRLWNMSVAASCYADCDESGGPAPLNVFDFLCFQNRFAGADPYACDCDLSTGSDVCDLFDFLCFQNEFGAGCP
jgi:hypothetical protein